MSSVIMRVVYVLFCLLVFNAAIELGDILTMIVTMLSAIFGFIPPSVWDKKIRIKYWQMCITNIFLIIAAILIETAFKM